MHTRLTPDRVDGFRQYRDHKLLPYVSWSTFEYALEPGDKDFDARVSIVIRKWVKIPLWSACRADKRICIQIGKGCTIALGACSP